MNTTTTHHKNKSAQSEILPHRSALTRLTRGDPAQRTMGQYAKATPSMTNTAPFQFMAGQASGLKTEAMPYSALANATGEP